MDFGGGPGGEADASPQRAARAEPTPATGKRPLARRVFGERARWRRVGPLWRVFLQRGSGGEMNRGNGECGFLDFTRNNRDNTNLTLIRRGLLYPFVGAVGVYKCPADRGTGTFMGGTHPRVRSMSMNGWLGTASESLDSWLRTELGPGYRIRVRQSDLIEPAPSSTWVFLDEREESIEDGWFGVNMTKSVWRGSWPGSYHHRAGGLAFADGHAEIRRWVDPRSCPPVKKNGDLEGDALQPGNPDIRWLQDRTTGRP